jgi:hypothetical protein
MKVRVTNDARDDLRSIKSFIVLRDAAAGTHVIANIARVLSRLRLLPRLGHRGAVDGTYEINVPHLPFVIDCGSGGGCKRSWQQSAIVTGVGSGCARIAREPVSLVPSCWDRP